MDSNFESAKQEVLRFIEETDCNSVEELLAARDDLPKLSHWELRKIFADTRRKAVRKKVNEAYTMVTEALDAKPLSKKAIEAIQAGWMRPVKVEAQPVKVLKPIFEKQGSQYLVFSDVHAPDEDASAMDVMYQIGQSLDLDGVVINGDLFDVSSLSRYTPNAEQHLRWVDERLASVKVATQIRQNFPNVPIDFIPGNHDVRPINWVNANALPLQNLLTLEQWLGLDDPFLNFNVIHGGRVLLAEDSLLIKHGTKVSMHAGYSVKKEIDAHGMSVIMGHVHRRAVVEVTKTAHSLMGVELGCLSNLRPSYLIPEDTANWQHGFAVVTTYGSEFEVELVRVNNGKAQFRGKRFMSRI
jgi:UDP-2,3-diacylglucosamine pyrophosphatase LpxH